MWLARNDYRSANKALYDDYILSVSESNKTICDWGGIAFSRAVDNAMHIRTTAFEKAFPRLKLKPGEGPVEVEVEIRRVKK